MKLHASFKSLLPQAIFEHLEARGCLFQWREKVFQVCHLVVTRSMKKLISSIHHIFIKKKKRNPYLVHKFPTFVGPNI